MFRVFSLFWAEGVKAGTLGFNSRDFVLAYFAILLYSMLEHTWSFMGNYKQGY